MRTRSTGHAKCIYQEPTAKLVFGLHTISSVVVLSLSCASAEPLSTSPRLQPGCRYRVDSQVPKMQVRVHTLHASNAVKQQIPPSFFLYEKRFGPEREGTRIDFHSINVPFQSPEFHPHFHPAAAAPVPLVLQKWRRRRASSSSWCYSSSRRRRPPPSR